MSEARFLADTHILLWALADDARLPERHRAILLSDAEIFVSAASIWEIAIKKSLGKLKVPDGLTLSLKQAGFRALDVTIAHADAVTRLPFHHSDPFDRLLIAQGRLEGLTIITVDEKFTLYDIETV
jgi:PIN domain nuclease of toxin-antitoxin system